MNRSYGIYDGSGSLRYTNLQGIGICIPLNCGLQEEMKYQLHLNWSNVKLLAVF